MAHYTYRSRLKLVLCPVNVEHWSELDEQPPPGPTPNAHELSDILLDAADGNVLNLQKRQNKFRLARFIAKFKKILFD